MSELTNPHDRFFKESFSRPEIARDFLARYLPPTVATLFDLDTLELRKDSFIDRDLQQPFSDLLYQLSLRQGAKVFVYTLLEHKSSVEPLTSFQLLRYKVRILD